MHTESDYPSPRRRARAPHWSRVLVTVIALAGATAAGATASRRPVSLAARGVPVVPAVPRNDSARTTLDGVYTLVQANTGRDIFAGVCKECHANNVYAGQPLRQRWNGRTLGELFGYLRREMPKSNPGSLSDQDYTNVIAYLLRLNEMPTGRQPLAVDSSALHDIRFAAPRPVSPSSGFR